MRTRTVTFGLTAVAAAALASLPARISSQQLDPGAASVAVATAAASRAVPASVTPDVSPDILVRERTAIRLELDLQALGRFRPGYPFWQHVFQIPDGAIAFGSAADGRLLAVFPTQGNWTRDAVWHEPTLASRLTLDGLPRRLNDRRDQVARLLNEATGPIVHNPTRGRFLAPNEGRYGRFLTEWARIYERFGVPAELGLAQGLIESGLNGTVRSEARAIGFCQWLSSNWSSLNRLSPHVIEGYNQTTQAPYCAAYLTVLATKYGSFIPALSEHHAGGTNVGRAITNGEWLGGQDPREAYFLGSAFIRDLRELVPRSYRDVYGTYGPRSFFYTEMVFGNTFNVRRISATQPQDSVHAMRTTRAVPLSEVSRRTGLSVDEIRRYNPALIRQVPARATLYLPEHLDDFGQDVAFWHRPPSTAFSRVLGDFLSLPPGPQVWDDESFVPVLRNFAERFRETGTEEGVVMGTVLAYTIQEILTSGRARILEEFRTSPRVHQLFERARAERNAALGIGRQ